MELHIVGNRPQLVKFAGFVDDQEEVEFLYTSQHYDYDLSGRMMDDLEIKNPDFRLDYSYSSRSKNMASFINDISLIIKQYSVHPKVYVYGDSLTTLAGAIAAKLENCVIVPIPSGQS